MRWFWPGLSGEYMPRTERIAFDELDIRHVPSIQIRSLAINSPHYDEDTMIWMARNRMNVHNLQGSRARLSDMKKEASKWSKAVTMPSCPNRSWMLIRSTWPNTAVSDKNPPQRPPHLCWSNPDVQKAMAKVIAEWWDNEPEMDRVRFFGADHNHFCECEACRLCPGCQYALAEVP